jgi:hypothetical protein
MDMFLENMCYNESLMHRDAEAYAHGYQHLLVVEEPEEPTNVGRSPMSAIQSVYEPEPDPQ